MEKKNKTSSPADRVAADASIEKTPARSHLAESQARRRVKYGANVAIATTLAILLAAVLIWAAQAQNLKLFKKEFSLRARADLTANFSNSLSKQTQVVVRELPENITLVSLYPKLNEDERAKKEDTYNRVLDLLHQYHEQNPAKISVMSIDQIAEPAKLDAWIARIRKDYGQNVPQFEALLNTQTIEQIRKLSMDQAAKMDAQLAAYPPGGIVVNPPAAVNELRRLFDLVRSFAESAQSLERTIRGSLNQTIPDYLGAKGELVSDLSRISGQMDELTASLQKIAQDFAAPKPIREYAGSAIGPFEQLHKQIDATLKEASALDSVKLKLDEIRRKLIPPDQTKTPPPAIVAMSKDDLRVIDFDSVWIAGSGSGVGPSDERHLRFAGEQQVTRALLALSQPMQKTVVFIRDGDPPALKGPAAFEGEPEYGPFTDIANRLRSYNFRVLEKDLTPPAQLEVKARNYERHGKHLAREPDDDEIKDAVWVITPRQLPRGSDQELVLGQRLKEHLEPQPAGGDLAVDDSDAKVVRSASHPFAKEDAGRTLDISPTAGWTAGRYTIAKVEGGAATLDRSPAVAKTAGGLWEELRGIDLAVVSEADHTVRSKTRPFAESDRGDVLRLKPGGDWKPGRYKIVDVKKGIATLDASPAPAGAAGGAWDVAPGSAICLMNFRSDSLSPALKDYGLKTDPNVIIVHAIINGSADSAKDDLEQVRRLRTDFVLNQYGSHEIAKPVNGLTFVLSLSVPVIPTGKTPGVTLSMLLPIPENVQAWGETDLGFLTDRNAPAPTYDRRVDMAPPLWAGAAAERFGCGRLVVLGDVESVVNPILRMNDPKMAEQHLDVPIFPGNSELFTNSVFWLAGEERMIGLSPASLDTPRIAQMSDGMLSFWRIGIFLIALPLLPMLGGYWMYRSRQG